MSAPADPPRLHLLNLDGTLLHHSAAAVETSRRLRPHNANAELETAFS